MNFDSIFSYVPRLIIGLIWCAGDQSGEPLLIFESHDGPGGKFSDFEIFRSIFFVFPKKITENNNDF